MEPIVEETVETQDGLNVGFVLCEAVELLDHTNDVSCKIIRAVVGRGQLPCELSADQRQVYGVTALCGAGQAMEGPEGLVAQQLQQHPLTLLLVCGAQSLGPSLLIPPIAEPFHGGGQVLAQQAAPVVAGYHKQCRQVAVEVVAALTQVTHDHSSGLAAHTAAGHVPMGPCRNHIGGGHRGGLSPFDRHPDVRVRGEE